MNFLSVDLINDLQPIFTIESYFSVETIIVLTMNIY